MYDAAGDQHEQADPEERSKQHQMWSVALLQPSSRHALPVSHASSDFCGLLSHESSAVQQGQLKNSDRNTNQKPNCFGDLKPRKLAKDYFQATRPEKTEMCLLRDTGHVAKLKASAIPCKEAGESSRFPLGSENMLVIGGVVKGGRCATMDLFSCMRPRLERALSYRAGVVLCRMN